MSKLHELLAVKESVDGQATKTRADLTATFKSKRHLFEESRTVYTALAEGAKTEVESQKDIQSSVAKEMLWVSGLISKALDVNFQIDVANTQAKADVVVEDGTKILSQVPATNLLQLERRMGELHSLIQEIPTLDPAKGFLPDTTREHGIYKARDVVKPRTKKENKILVMYPATKEHPAQTQLVGEDIKVGTILEQQWSSMITPGLKAELLTRVEDLTRAIKKARAQANEHSIDTATNKVGEKIFAYVLEPLRKESLSAAAD